LVRAWAERLDLVAPGDLDRFEDRHISDSLRLLPVLDELPDGPCVDVGSGAGLPGVPLAIASGRRWRLIEPRRRRAAFLEEVVRELALDCEVVMLAAEEAAVRPDLRAAHVLGTARAVADPEAAFALITPLVAPTGMAAVFLGERSQIPRGAVEWAPGIATMPGIGEEGARE
jgi:16S rRNA (guanine527-N7)-methyltransferase